jgi:predicted nucleotide-binding protein
MTGDDVANEDEARVRENVMHEIGFFQGRYGRNSVVLLHEEGVNIPSNLAGVAYIPFPEGNIGSGFRDAIEFAVLYVMNLLKETMTTDSNDLCTT